MRAELLEAWLGELEAWYEEHSVDGEIEQYNLCAALAVTERMRKKYPLDESDYITDKSQVRTSGSLIRNILARFGEKRPYLSEGGRTTRASVVPAKNLASRLQASVNVPAASTINLGRILDQVQGWLVGKVQETYLDRQRLRVDIDLARSLREVVGAILGAAAEINKTGQVAQHLVGAKLAMRFPDMAIENHGATTADQQLGRKGDFQIDGTVFHVTVAPAEKLFLKCAENRREGLRPVVLVPNGRKSAAIQLAENQGIVRDVEVYGLEDFLGQNVGEMGRFEQDGIRETVKRLLETYNERVDVVETDKGLLIKIPEWLSDNG